MTSDSSAGQLATTDQPRFPMTDNMDNIGLIKRMWRAQWPEFSWLTIPVPANLPAGSDLSKYEASRCYQMFAPDISRVGYGEPDPANGNHCRVWSIMCPQQGIWIQEIEGTLNIEVTVTSSGGWVTEDPLELEAQITIQPKIWFSPDTIQNNKLIGLLWKMFDSVGLPFPASKDKAIKLTAFGVNAQDQPVDTPYLDIVPGLDPNYQVPPFAQHTAPDDYGLQSATQVYVAVEIGQIIPSDHPDPLYREIVDWFNGVVMAIFNAASGNLLQYQNVLSWNIWALAPEEVYTPEWQMHADYWRFSLDVNHRSPDGNGRNPMYYGGGLFNPEKAAICALITDLLAGLKTKLDELCAKHPFVVAIINEIEQEIASIVAANCGPDASGPDTKTAFM